MVLCGVAPSPDPNWFYSSLAQSSAGAVGLLGAVLITRLQAQVTNAREPRRLFTRTVKEYRRTAQEHYDHAMRFQAVAERQLDTLRDAQSKGYTVASFAEYRTLGASGGVNTVPVVQEIAHIEEQMRHAPAVVAALQRAARAPTGKDFMGVHQTFSAQKQQLTGSAAGIAQQAWARGEAVVDKITRLREQTNSRPAKLALAVMVLLSVAGLIAPLGWLTAIGDWSKPTLLILFAVGIIGLLAVVWDQIYELDRVGDVEDFDRAVNGLD